MHIMYTLLDKNTLSKKCHQINRIHQNTYKRIGDNKGWYHNVVRA